MKYSVIDIGSNTIRLIIYNVEDGNVKKLLDKKNTAGLASYINDNTMNEKGIKKTYKSFKKSSFNKSNNRYRPRIHICDSCYKKCFKLQRDLREG
ncbi:MAG: hypothetical protein Q4B36_02490 [Tissierellia bacterium]|nr:hypothetical protein [Tissierellia bacterium]